MKYLKQTASTPLLDLLWTGPVMILSTVESMGNRSIARLRMEWVTLSGLPMSACKLNVSEILLSSSGGISLLMRNLSMFRPTRSGKYLSKRPASQCWCWKCSVLHGHSFIFPTTYLHLEASERWKRDGLASSYHSWHWWQQLHHADQSCSRYWLWLISSGCSE